MARESSHESNVRMGKARHPSEDTVYEAARIPFDKNRPKQLRCYYCEAKVHAVVGSLKEKHSRTPHFRRNRSTKRSPNPHEPGCWFNIEVRIKEIQDESNGLLEKVPGKNLYRLPWPEAFTRPPRPESTSTATTPELVFGKEAITLLNTAAKITALLEQYQHTSTSIDEEFQATCHGKRVPWLNFFYSTSRAWQLDDRVRKGPLPHPVVVMLRINWKPGNRWVFGTAIRPGGQTEDGPKEDEELRFFVNADSSELITTAFQLDIPGREQLYLAYGMWKLEPGNPPRATLTITGTGAVAPLPADLNPEIVRGWYGQI